MSVLHDVLVEAERSGRAIGHFNIGDFVIFKAVVASAHELKVPVLVGASEGEREFIGLRQLAALVRSVRDEVDVPLFLNADHTHSLGKAIEAVRSGFDSIAFDASALPFDENVRRTKEAVDALKGINPDVLVEGEIGDIGTGSEIHQEAPDLAHGLTTPVEARQFVESTGVDILAPAVGNMHGMVKSMIQGGTQKHLDIARIVQIKTAAQVPLTLHGGSGTADEDLQKAIVAGINIVHINTEVRIAWRRGIEEALAAQPAQVVPYRLLSVAAESVGRVVRARLTLFNRVDGRGERSAVDS